MKRVQKNIVESDIVTDFPYNWAAPEEETPEHCLLKQEKKEQVWKALNRLNETQRTLIVAHYIHNQTYDYISKKYGIEKSKVRRIIKRGLNVLRCLLESRNREKSAVAQSFGFGRQFFCCHQMRRDRKINDRNLAKKV